MLAKKSAEVQSVDLPSMEMAACNARFFLLLFFPRTDDNGDDRDNDDDDSAMTPEAEEFGLPWHHKRANKPHNKLFVLVLILFYKFMYV